MSDMLYLLIAPVILVIHNFNYKTHTALFILMDHFMPQSVLSYFILRLVSYSLNYSYLVRHYSMWYFMLYMNFHFTDYLSLYNNNLLLLVLSELMVYITVMYTTNYYMCCYYTTHMSVLLMYLLHFMLSWYLHFRFNYLLPHSLLVTYLSMFIHYSNMFMLLSLHPLYLHILSMLMVH